MKESVVIGHLKMRYSFSCCSSLPCISLLITHGSGGVGVYARMRGITPARPQFETRPLLLDIIEVPRPLNKTGLYSREASIRGNTVYILYIYIYVSDRLCTYHNTRLPILQTLVQFYILPHTPTCSVCRVCLYVCV